MLFLRALAVARGEVGDAEVVARLREVGADFDGLLERLDRGRVLFQAQVSVAHQVEVVGVERAAGLVVGADGGGVGGARLLGAAELLLRRRDVVVRPAPVGRLARALQGGLRRLQSLRVLAELVEDVGQKVLRAGVVRPEARGRLRLRQRLARLVLAHEDEAEDVVRPVVLGLKPRGLARRAQAPVHVARRGERGAEQRLRPGVLRREAGGLLRRRDELRVLPLEVVEHGLPHQRLGAVGLRGERAREGVLRLAVARHARVGAAEPDERLGRAGLEPLRRREGRDRLLVAVEREVRVAEPHLRVELVGVGRAQRREPFLGAVEGDVGVPQKHLREGGGLRPQPHGLLQRRDGLRRLVLLQQQEADREVRVRRELRLGGGLAERGECVGVAPLLLVDLAEVVVRARAEVAERGGAPQRLAGRVVALERVVDQPRVDERLFDPRVRLRGDDVGEGRERLAAALQVHVGQPEAVVGLDVARVGAQRLLVAVGGAPPVLLRKVLGAPLRLLVGLGVLGGRGGARVRRTEEGGQQKEAGRPEGVGHFHRF